jgi:cystathionine beta-lyase
MKYDFDKAINRRGTNCVKWDVAKEDGVIPMWVADMDFEIAPAIKAALRQRVEHGVFGYTRVPSSYYQAVVNWFGRRHQWRIDSQWIIYTPGVVPAISAIIKALAKPGDKVLIQTPVYNCFFTSIKNNDCGIAENALIYEDGTYHIDWEDFERKTADPSVRVFLLCNPHNPAGRVWTREELERMNDICLKNSVTVIADEIHCELVMPGYTFTPFASISESALRNSVTCNSPSKSFNIAGLQISNIICSDDSMRRRIDRAVNINEVCDVNPFGVIALQAAYNESEEWLDSLNQYIYANYQALCDFVAQHLPQLKVLKLEGTYLVWIDIRATGMTSDELTDKLLKEGKVMVNSGTMYGKPAGEGFIRLNIACPRAQMNLALQRMEKCL